MVQPHENGDLLVSPDLPIRSSYNDIVVGDQSVASIFDRLIQDRKTAPFNYYLATTTLSLMRALGLPREFTLIDAACGNGDLLNHISQRFDPKPGRLIGYDQSTAMVNIARGKHSELEIVIGDLRKPELKVEQANIITCINGIHYLPTVADILTAYIGSYQLLQSGGYLIIATQAAEGINARFRLTQEELHRRISVGQRELDWSMPDENGKPAFRMRFYAYLHEEHTDSLRQAGFGEIQEFKHIPPPEDIANFNPRVYEILRDKPVFVFFVAKKPSIA